MKHAIVNGIEISGEAVQFELDRLVRFYMSHGMTMEEVKQNLTKLEEKALEQAIGAKLLLDRAMAIELPVAASDIDAEVAKVVEQVGGKANFEEALKAQGVSEENFRKELEKGVRVNMLVEQACAHTPEPTEQEVADYFAAHKAEFVEPHQAVEFELHGFAADFLSVDYRFFHMSGIISYSFRMTAARLRPVTT